MVESREESFGVQSVTTRRDYFRDVGMPVQGSGFGFRGLSRTPILCIVRAHKTLLFCKVDLLDMQLTSERLKCDSGENMLKP